MAVEESYLPTPNEATATHEASHAVVAVRLGIKFESVSMSVYQYTARRGDIVGRLKLTPVYGVELEASGPANAEDRPKLENLAIVALAGEAGQARLEQRPCDFRLNSAEGDYEFVEKLASLLYADPADRDAFIERQKVTACELVSDPLCFHQIECVANQLRVLLDMSYDDVSTWMKAVEAREANPHD